jgi:hypothetical protein
MNQKGIVLSGLVYVLLIFFLLLLLSLLMVMWYRQNTLNSLSDNANSIYDDTDVVINGPYYNNLKGVNQPVLATGMTPVKWDGTKWVTTTIDDTDWYDYTEANKKWANATTADGSMWVWIPRYVYKISSGWHSNVTGTIDIQFSMATDDTRNGTVSIVNTNSSNDSNNTWTNHPAFTFGDIELTGIWVAKFEAGGTADFISIKPNVISLHNLTIGEMFTASRNMENNDNYGWGSDGKSIDTHMTKNTERGAVAYLSKSIYGKNTEEVWINPADNYTTGCAGDSFYSAITSGCLRTYETPNGVMASTTGNIYGIYDMSGGAWEYTAAYVDNNHGNLMAYGSSILNANIKYKDIYPITIDDEVNNYNNAINKKGDAVYETSGPADYPTSWFEGDLSNMPYSNIPYFICGGQRASSWDAGVFAFFHSTGSSVDGWTGFRPVLLVNAGL